MRGGEEGPADGMGGEGLADGMGGKGPADGMGGEELADRMWEGPADGRHHFSHLATHRRCQFTLQRLRGRTG